MAYNQAGAQYYSWRRHDDNKYSDLMVASLYDIRESFAGMITGTYDRLLIPANLDDYAKKIYNQVAYQLRMYDVPQPAAGGLQFILVGEHQAFIDKYIELCGQGQRQIYNPVLEIHNAVGCVVGNRKKFNDLQQYFHDEFMMDYKMLVLINELRAMNINTYTKFSQVKHINQSELIVVHTEAFTDFIIVKCNFATIRNVLNKYTNSLQQPSVDMSSVIDDCKQQLTRHKTSFHTVYLSYIQSSNLLAEHIGQAYTELYVVLKLLQVYSLTHIINPFYIEEYDVHCINPNHLIIPQQYQSLHDVIQVLRMIQFYKKDYFDKFSLRYQQQGTMNYGEQLHIDDKQLNFFRAWYLQWPMINMGDLLMLDKQITFVLDVNTSTLNARVVPKNAVKYQSQTQGEILVKFNQKVYEHDEYDLERNKYLVSNIDDNSIHHRIILEGLPYGDIQLATINPLVKWICNVTLCGYYRIQLYQERPLQYIYNMIGACSYLSAVNGILRFAQNSKKVNQLYVFIQTFVQNYMLHKAKGGDCALYSYINKLQYSKNSAGYGSSAFNNFNQLFDSKSNKLSVNIEAMYYFYPNYNNITYNSTMDDVQSDYFAQIEQQCNKCHLISYVDARVSLQLSVQQLYDKKLMKCPSCFRTGKETSMSYMSSQIILPPLMYCLVKFDQQNINQSNASPIYEGSQYTLPMQYEYIGCEIKLQGHSVFMHKIGSSFYICDDSKLKYIEDYFKKQNLDEHKMEELMYDLEQHLANFQSPQSVRDNNINLLQLAMFCQRNISKWGQHNTCNDREQTVLVIGHIRISNDVIPVINIQEFALSVSCKVVFSFSPSSVVLCDQMDQIYALDFLNNVVLGSTNQPNDVLTDLYNEWIRPLVPSGGNELPFGGPFNNVIMGSEHFDNTDKKDTKPCKNNTLSCILLSIIVIILLMLIWQKQTEYPPPKNNTIV